jgi:hypothetical protein
MNGPCERLRWPNGSRTVWPLTATYPPPLWRPKPPTAPPWTGPLVRQHKGLLARSSRAIRAGRACM